MTQNSDHPTPAEQRLAAVIKGIEDYLQVTTPEDYGDISTVRSAMTILLRLATGEIQPIDELTGGALPSSELGL